MLEVWSLYEIEKEEEEAQIKANGCIEAYNKEFNGEFATKPTLLEFANRICTHSKEWIQVLQSTVNDDNAKRTYPTADICEIPQAYYTFQPPNKTKTRGAFNKKKYAARKKANFAEFVNAQE